MSLSIIIVETWNESDASSHIMFVKQVGILHSKKRCVENRIDNYLPSNHTIKIQWERFTLKKSLGEMDCQVNINSNYERYFIISRL
jgi:hypothetical protein